MKGILIVLLVAVLAAPVALAEADGRTFTITNPLKTNSFEDLFKLISDSLVEIAIPIAVILYVWAGVLYLMAGADKANIVKAKLIFKNTTIGLVVIFIAGGFVDLVKSFLNAE